jgi:hypothetical protein
MTKTNHLCFPQDIYPISRVLVRQRCRRVDGLRLRLTSICAQGEIPFATQLLNRLSAERATVNRLGEKEYPDVDGFIREFGRVQKSTQFRYFVLKIRDLHQTGLEQETISLFEHFRNPLLRYLSSFRLGPPDGEEVVQEVFLSLFQHLQSGKSRENLRGWLFRVDHNLALKRRHQTRRDFHPQATQGTGERASGRGRVRRQLLYRSKNIVRRQQEDRICCLSRSVRITQEVQLSG